MRNTNDMIEDIIRRTFDINLPNKPTFNNYLDVNLKPYKLEILRGMGTIFPKQPVDYLKKFFKKLINDESDKTYRSRLKIYPNSENFKKFSDLMTTILNSPNLSDIFSKNWIIQIENERREILEYFSLEYTRKYTQFKRLLIENNVSNCVQIIGFSELTVKNTFELIGAERTEHTEDPDVENLYFQLTKKKLLQKN